MDAAPRVSIGMPVRNGQAYIRQAIDSILAQTFTDFELIVCDNASTDDTEQICRDYAARDPRVRYIRNAADIGPAGNFNKCAVLARGAYFRWHNHDDVCAPEHLAKCVALLDADPSALLAYPSTIIIDEAGTPSEDRTLYPQLDAFDPVKRFAELVLVDHRRHLALETFGLMRHASLQDTPLHGAYARGDSVLLARLALRGRFVKLPDRLFLWRRHSTQGTVVLKRARSDIFRRLGTGPLPPPEYWDPSRKDRLNFPEWNLFKQYWVSIAPAPLSAGEKLRCYGIMAVWLWRNAPKLLRDVLFAIELVVMRKRDPAPA